MFYDDLESTISNLGFWKTLSFPPQSFYLFFNCLLKIIFRFLPIAAITITQMPSIQNNMAPLINWWITYVFHENWFHEKMCSTLRPWRQRNHNWGRCFLRRRPQHLASMFTGGSREEFRRYTFVLLRHYRPPRISTYYGKPAYILAFSCICDLGRCIIYISMYTCLSSCVWRIRNTRISFLTVLKKKNEKWLATKIR